MSAAATPGRRVPLNRPQINRASRYAVFALSLIALGTVLTGYLQPPQADEGTAAHIFQLSILLMAPMGLLYLATADWEHPLRSARPMAVPAAAVLLAFAALYCLEHNFYPEYYR